MAKKKAPPVSQPTSPHPVLPNPVEGSAAEEATESPAFEAQEDHPVVHRPHNSNSPYPA